MSTDKLLFSLLKEYKPWELKYYPDYIYKFRSKDSLVSLKYDLNNSDCSFVEKISLLLYVAQAYKWISLKIVHRMELFYDGMSQCIAVRRIKRNFIWLVCLRYLYTRIGYCIRKSFMAIIAVTHNYFTTYFICVLIITYNYVIP